MPWKMSTSNSVLNSSDKLSHLTPRKQWGQHFLRNPHIARRIVQLLELQPGDTVVEIGPGTGALTEHLVLLPIRLVAIEIDPRCLELLRHRFPAELFPHLELVHGDVLEYDLRTLAQQTLQHKGRKLALIGNLPYNISSPVLFRLFQIAPLLSQAVFMVQREVAYRLTALPGTKQYGILRLACWVVAEAELCFHVPATAFRPAPQVVSSVVSLRFRPQAWSGALYVGFLELLHAVFGQRRKQLRNTLRQYLSRLPLPLPVEEILQHAGIAPTRRPEELTPDEFVRLYRVIQARQSHVGA